MAAIRETLDALSAVLAEAKKKKKRKPTRASGASKPFLPPPVKTKKIPKNLRPPTTKERVADNQPEPREPQKFRTQKDIMVFARMTSGGGPKASRKEEGGLDAAIFVTLMGALAKWERNKVAANAHVHGVFAALGKGVERDKGTLQHVSQWTFSKVVAGVTGGAKATAPIRALIRQALVELHKDGKVDGSKRGAPLDWGVVANPRKSIGAATFFRVQDATPPARTGGPQVWADSDLYEAVKTPLTQLGQWFADTIRMHDEPEKKEKVRIAFGKHRPNKDDKSTERALQRAYDSLHLTVGQVDKRKLSKLADWTKSLLNNIKYGRIDSAQVRAHLKWVRSSLKPVIGAFLTSADLARLGAPPKFRLRPEVEPE